MQKLKESVKKISSIDFIPLIISYVILIVFFAIKSPHFFNVTNFLNIALYAANIGILACTMTLIIISGHIDLSIGSVIALSGIVMGTLLQRGVPTGIAILACLGIGVLAGIFNGLLITKVGVNAFITTLAGMEIFRGTTYLVTNGKAVTITNDMIKKIGRGYTFSVPNAVIIMLVIVVIFSLVAKHTVFGRRIFVIGGNGQVAYLSGINVSGNLMGLFILNGMMCGVASVIYCSQLGAAMPTNATGMEFDVISAVILGGASLSGGKGSIIGALFGALLLGTLSNGMVMLNIHTYWQQIISGIVLVLAVVLDIIKNKRALRTLG
ncbi:MAG: ABC transporter permease [Lachnospiraceae bacterium]